MIENVMSKTHWQQPIWYDKLLWPNQFVVRNESVLKQEMSCANQVYLGSSIYH